ncbi:MAG TPA: DUF4386 family protein [Gemmatimonadaceae bacterium]|nr:DUF4386 family protein [Gemmatimonadaceae bacterium]
MTDRTMIRVGGLALVGGALAFMAVFAYLAANFNYPEVLDGTADTVLPALVATGSGGRLAWAIYSFLPLIWLPAAAGAYQALGQHRRGAMQLAVLFAAAAALAMMLGLMRWPTIHWALGQSFVNAEPAQRATMTALFDGLNTYLGNYLGEFLGELSFNMFFLLTSTTWLASSQQPRWVGWLGLLTATAGFLGMFRNITALVAPIAAVNNYLLPLFMIVFGGALFRIGGRLTRA